MRASPRISVLGESGDPCIADNGPSENHKTVIFLGDGFTVVEQAMDTFLLQHETVSRVAQPLVKN